MAGGTPTIVSSIGLPTIKFLTSNGISSATHNINGNYSAAPTDFYHTITSIGYNISTVLISLTDSVGFNYVDYGAIAGGLTNGVKFYFYDLKLNTEIPLLGGTVFKQNWEFLTVTQETRLTQFAGLPQTLTVNIRLIDDFGVPLHMNTGDKFIVRLNDDLTGLVGHVISLRGIAY
jgi:hypothetical protein